MTDIDDLDDCQEPWRSEIERLRKELGDLIGLAEAAMRDANRDGAEYDINEELTDAREALK